MSIIHRSIDDYKSFVGSEVITKIRRAAQPLQNKHVIMVNSTPSGGGVAEILNSMVLLLNSLNIKTEWLILKGSKRFFTVTKSFHNAFQGESIAITPEMKKTYHQVNYDNAQMSHFELADLVVVHDPQPLLLIKYLEKKVPWIWRFHPDMSNPNPVLLKYLKRYIEQYDSMIVSSEKYVNDSLSIKKFIIPPSIDPLADKNIFLDKKTINKVLKDHGIRLDKPIITQVSRFDKWKDPLGVINVFKEVRKKVNCQLVLIGNLAEDDPEGPEIYKQVIVQANKEKDISVIIEENSMLVNALQRVSSIILQKSIKEGFALTVSEALWKGTPVVASRAGGIPLQVLHGNTGYLATGIKETSEACIKLLKDKKLRDRLGSNGKEHVRKNFLITRHLLDYLNVFNYYLSRKS